MLLARVELAHASRLINHGPTVLVVTEHQGRRNVMAAAWSMPVEFTPPRIAVVVDKMTFTRELLQASGGFAIGLPCPALAELAAAVRAAFHVDLEHALEQLGPTQTLRAVLLTARLALGRHCSLRGWFGFLRYHQRP